MTDEDVVIDIRETTRTTVEVDDDEVTLSQWDYWTGSDLLASEEPRSTDMIIVSRAEGRRLAMAILNAVGVDTSEKVPPDEICWCAAYAVGHRRGDGLCMVSVVPRCGCEPD